MAGLYVESLLAFRPQGPYLLAGSSLGGFLAFEMARRLRALGHEVALLALIDSPAPGGGPGAQEDDDGDGRGELAILNYVTGGNPTMPLERLRTLAPEERLELVLQRGREAGAFTSSFGLDELRWLVQVVSANQEAMREYLPGESDVRLTFLHAAESDSSADSWSAVALGGVEAHEVPGNHISLHFPPHAEAVAARLSGCIAEALARAGRRSPAVADAGLPGSEAGEERHRPASRSPVHPP
jgi:thioesterase domain-containing protein